MFSVSVCLSVCLSVSLCLSLSLSLSLFVGLIDVAVAVCISVDEPLSIRFGTRTAGVSFYCIPVVFILDGSSIYFLDNNLSSSSLHEDNLHPFIVSIEETRTSCPYGLWSCWVVDRAGSLSGFLELGETSLNGIKSVIEIHTLIILGFLVQIPWEIQGSCSQHAI